MGMRECKGSPAARPCTELCLPPYTCISLNLRARMQELFSVLPEGKQRWGAAPPRPHPHPTPPILSTALFQREMFVFPSKCWWFGLHLPQPESRGICCQV